MKQFMKNMQRIRRLVNDTDCVSISRSRKPMIRLVNLGHCLLYRRKGLPFIILKPVQREPERRDNGRRIVSLSNGVKTAMTGTIMPLSEKVVYPFLSTLQKLRAFILSAEISTRRNFHFSGMVWRIVSRRFDFSIRDYIISNRYSFSFELKNI